MKKIIFMLLLTFLVGQVNCSAKKFRAMSFNIRLLTTADGDNIWANRKDDVCKFLKKSKPDVFGLQEATLPQLSDIIEGTEKYAYVGSGRDDGKQGGEYSPVCYQKEKYKLISNGTFWLSETPEKPSLGWDAACKRVCTWAILKNIKTGKSFIFANTHLDHVGKQARMNGAMLIKERLSRISNNLPIIITGDFNVGDTDPAYATMRERLFPLNDAYKIASKRSGKKSSFHSWGKIPDNEGGRIDFIFLSSDLEVKEACIFNGSLGKGRYLSDHHPYYADIVLKSF